MVSIQHEKYESVPNQIEGLLHKKINSSITQLFKSSVERFFYFDIKKCQFGYKSNSKFSYIHTKKEILNYTSYVDKEEPLIKKFKFGFKIFTVTRNYVLFTDHKEFYWDWMRILNFYFYKFDILKNRKLSDEIEIEIPTIIEQDINHNKIKKMDENKETITKSIVKHEEVITDYKNKEIDYFNNRINNLFNTKKIEKEKDTFQIENLHIKFLGDNQIMILTQSDKNDTTLNNAYLEDPNPENENLNKIKADVSKRILKKIKDRQELILKENKFLSFEENQIKIKHEELKKLEEKKIKYYDELGREIMQINNNSEYVPQIDVEQQSKDFQPKTPHLKFLHHKSIVGISKTFLKNDWTGINKIDDSFCSQNKTDTSMDRKELKDINLNQGDVHHIENFDQNVKTDEIPADLPINNEITEVKSEENPQVKSNENPPISNNEIKDDDFLTWEFDLHYESFYSMPLPQSN